MVTWMMDDGMMVQKHVSGGREITLFTMDGFGLIN